MKYNSATRKVKIQWSDTWEETKPPASAGTVIGEVIDILGPADKTWYLVRWFPTWEPMENVNAFGL